MRKFTGEPFSIVLQAGGQSTRMGMDKGLVTFRGLTLTEFILKQVEGLGSEYLIISNQPVNYSRFKLPVFSDVIPGMGALGGLYSAIYHASCDLCLILACDMPFVSRRLLEYLHKKTNGYEVAIPRPDKTEYAEPFRAYYRKACLAPIRSALERGKRRVISFFPDVRVNFIDWPEISPFDPEGLTFFNVNAPDDLIEAERIAQKLGI